MAFASSRLPFSQDEESRAGSPSAASEADLNDQTFGDSFAAVGSFANGCYLPAPAQRPALGEKRKSVTTGQWSVTTPLTREKSLAAWGIEGNDVQVEVDSKTSSDTFQMSASSSGTTSNTTATTDSAANRPESPAVELHSLPKSTSALATPGNSQAINQAARPSDVEPAAKTPQNGISPNDPFAQDLLDRLIRVEFSLFPLRDLTTQVASLRTDVDFLLRAQRQATSGPPGSSASSAGGPTRIQNGSDVSASVMTGVLNNDGGNQETIRQLSSQISSLSGTVAQLLSVQASQHQQSLGVQRPQSSPVANQPEQKLSAATPAFNPRPPLTDRSISLDPSIMTSGNRSQISDYETNLSILQQKWTCISPLISAQLFKSLLRISALSSPSKIQLKAIPCILQAGEDIVAQVSTPLESVISYALPAVQLCATSPPSNSVSVLVVTANVEAASFAHQIFQQLGSSLGVRSGLAVSSSASEDHAMLQRSRPHVLIGTPQTVLDLLAMRALGYEGGPKLLVLDEADALVNQQQSDLIYNIMRLLPSISPPSTSVSKVFDPFGDADRERTTSNSSGPRVTRQTAIFGRVMSPELLTMASSLQLREPVRVLVRKTPTSTVGRPGASRSSSGIESVLQGIRHFFLYVAIANRAQGSMNGPGEQAWKLEAVADLVEDVQTNQIVIYCGSIEAVEAVSYRLTSRGIDALALHGDMGSSARSSIMSKFSSPHMSGKLLKKCLVIYDVLCRTMSDLYQVPLVINFDLPPSVEAYVHSVSSAAPSGYGRGGAAVNVITSDEDIVGLRRIESFYGIRVQELPPNHSSLA